MMRHEHSPSGPPNATSKTETSFSCANNVPFLRPTNQPTNFPFFCFSSSNSIKLLSSLSSTSSQFRREKTHKINQGFELWPLFRVGEKPTVPSKTLPKSVSLMSTATSRYLNSQSYFYFRFRFHFFSEIFLVRVIGFSLLL